MNVAVSVYLDIYFYIRVCYIIVSNLTDGTNDVTSFKDKTRAQRVTNTPGQCHFLIKKYLKVNDKDIRQYIVYNASL